MFSWRCNTAAAATENWDQPAA